MRGLPVKKLAIVIIGAAILAVVLSDSTRAISWFVFPPLAGLTNLALILRDKGSIKKAVVIGIASIALTYILFFPAVFLVIALLGI